MMRHSFGGASVTELAQLVSIGNAGKRFAASGFNPKVLRTLDLLQKDEWKALDDAVVRVARTQLTIVADLRAAGLTRNLGGLGVMIDEYEKVSEIDVAEQNMTGVSAGQKDLPEYTLASVPVPMTFRDFQVNIRTLEASRRRGGAMDTVTAEMCTRRVTERLDDMVFNGSTIQVDGATIDGITTQGDRLTGTLGTPWTTATTSVIADLLAMIGALEAINYRGPYNVYVPVDYMSELRDDYSTSKGDRTFVERILAIEPVSSIKGSPDLSAEVVVIQMTSDVIDLSVGQDIVTVEWDSMGGLVTDFKIMAAIVPRVKASAISETGIAHYTE